MGKKSPPCPRSNINPSNPHFVGGDAYGWQSTIQPSVIIRGGGKHIVGVLVEGVAVATDGKRGCKGCWKPSYQHNTKWKINARSGTGPWVSVKNVDGTDIFTSTGNKPGVIWLPMGPCGRLSQFTPAGGDTGPAWCVGESRAADASGAAPTSCKKISVSGPAGKQMSQQAYKYDKD